MCRPQWLFGLLKKSWGPPFINSDSDTRLTLAGQMKSYKKIKGITPVRNDALILQAFVQLLFTVVLVESNNCFYSQQKVFDSIMLVG